jgi:hypothetical protein
MLLFFVARSIASEDQAIENGWEVHQPMPGMYKYACAPVL